ncbi:MAG: hypothetical protein K0Q50_316 [Vampirovibrio sp.]|jgi:hypothetical protein|nr:hypothetical protein [Vampirovibrio sp.]
MNNSSSKASYEVPPSLPAGVTALDMVLPPQVIPLLLLLLVITPIVVLTGESLFVPLIEWIRTRAMSAPGADSSLGDLPTYFFIKLIAFVALSFLGGFQLLLRIKTIYYTTWAKAFPRPHSLHVDYQTDSNRGMMALIQWKLYQVAMVCLPPLVIGTITFLVGLVELYLFNTFSDLSFVGLSVQLTVELFLIMMLGLFTLFSVLNSIWTALTSLFGDIVAVTEPDLPNPTIMQRCGRIAFCSPYVYVLFPAYLLLLAGTLGEVIWLLNAVDIHEFISFQANVPLILTLEVATFAWYLGFNFFKFYTYHHGLSIYYSKLPPQLKECFTPPPPAGSSSFSSSQSYTASR